MFCTAIKSAFFGRLYMFAPCSRMLAVILSHFFSHYLFLSWASNCRSVQYDVYHYLYLFFRQTLKTSLVIIPPPPPPFHVREYTEKKYYAIFRSAAWCIYKQYYMCAEVRVGDQCVYLLKCVFFVWLSCRGCAHWIFLLNTAFFGCHTHLST